MNENIVYTVYMHISPSNKKYIGITCNEPRRRWRNGYGYKEQSYFYNAINKYGWENFEHIIIAKGLEEDEAKWLEIELIKEWDTTNRDKGYNITLGGEGTNGWCPSEETRKKISEANKGRNPWENQSVEKIKEWKQNIGKANTGNKNSMYGKTGELNPWYGKHPTEESRQKMRESHIGKRHSEESKQKMSKTRKGHPPTNNLIILLEDTGEVFNSLTDCAKRLGYNTVYSLSKYLHGKLNNIYDKTVSPKKKVNIKILNKKERE